MRLFRRLSKNTDPSSIFVATINLCTIELNNLIFSSFSLDIIRLLVKCPTTSLFLKKPSDLTAMLQTLGRRLSHVRFAYLMLFDMTEQGDLIKGDWTTLGRESPTFSY